MILINFGVMRGGIHVYLGWLIKKFPDKSVVLYNNIQNFEDNHLKKRKIRLDDNRIQPIRSKIIEDEKKASLRVYSFEGIPVRNIKKSDLKKINPKGDEIINITIQLRNPYNNYASILSYVNNNDQSDTIKKLSDPKYFAKIWLNLTESIKKNQLVIYYDRFINDKYYREKLSNRLQVNSYIDILPKLKFGGGSSFNQKKNQKKKNQSSTYNNRYIEFEHDERMMELKEYEKIIKYVETHKQAFNINE